MRKNHSLSLFGDNVLPDVALPTIGYLAKPIGEWHRFCRGWQGFNAVLPMTWTDGYREVV